MMQDIDIDHIRRWQSSTTVSPLYGRRWRGDTTVPALQQLLVELPALRYRENPFEGQAMLLEGTWHASASDYMQLHTITCM